MSQTLYNDLANYNENRIQNRYLSFTYPIHSENKFIIGNALLEGYNCLPIVKTDSSGYFYFMLDNEKNGFYFQLVIRKLRGFLNCKIYSLNEEYEIDKSLFSIQSSTNFDLYDILTGNFIQGFIPISHCFISMSLDKLYKMIQQNRILISIETVDYPEGEICGLLTCLKFN
jgi:hypothetical protein